MQVLIISIDYVQAVLALKAREEEIRKVSQGSNAGLSKEESQPSGKVLVNSPYAVIVTPGRELADQVRSSRDISPVLTPPFRPVLW